MTAKSGGKKSGTAGRPKRVDAAQVQAEIVERVARVAEMRRNGITFQRAADEVGVSRQQAQKDWQQYLRSLDPPADREERRADIREQLEQAVERARLDEQSARSAGDLALADKCALRALRVLGELRKLDGIDAPVESVVTVRGVEVAPLDRLAEILQE